ncbi:hypothetical protein C2G38_2247484 [Gigaspora rosea]|uniref:chitin synthase n=1 Tax=Gigaspora rosea TaxID=44941 RepID=A0A397V140_9GLOM|nr:hypothetical protein C2G38_2247484 [Gigaspora rosea]
MEREHVWRIIELQPKNNNNMKKLLMICIISSIIIVNVYQPFAKYDTCNCKRDDIFMEELKNLYKEIDLLSKYDIEKIKIINSMYESFSIEHREDIRKAIIKANIRLLYKNETEPTIDFKNPSSIQEALKNATYRDIVISVSSTYLLYLFSSIIHFNILMIYAFCNTHDVSWVTKGDNINLGNLNGTSLTEEKDAVKIVIKDEDLDDAYLNIVNELNNKDQSHVEKRHRNAFMKKDDYYRLFRTYLVLSWIFTNGFVIFLFTSNTFTRYFSTYDYYSGTYNPYLVFGRLNDYYNELAC